MPYSIVEIDSDNISDEILQQLKNLCTEAVSEDKHEASANMQIENWQETPNSLLYILLIEKRFTKNHGGLLLLFKDSRVIAVSGYYRSDFDPGIFLMGVRSWVLKKDRFNLLIAKYLLPYQFEKIKALNAHTVAITFNDSTKSFAQLIERSNKNLTIKNKFFFGTDYPDFYKDMVFLKEPLKIKNVRQWVLIKKIHAYDFDWSSLHW